jgi:hypothetical protein
MKRLRGPPASKHNVTTPKDDSLCHYDAEKAGGTGHAPRRQRVRLPRCCRREMRYPPTASDIEGSRNCDRVVARLRELPALVLDFIEQTRVLDCDHCLVGESGGPSLNAGHLCRRRSDEHASARTNSSLAQQITARSLCPRRCTTT